MRSSRTLWPSLLLVALGGSIFAPSRAAQKDAMEEVRAPRGREEIRLKCGINLVPGSVSITTPDGRHTLQHADSPLLPGSFTVSPVGALRFGPKEGGKRYRISYRYEARPIAVLPVDDTGAPEEFAVDTRRMAEKALADHGYDPLPDSQVDRPLLEDRLYPSGQMTPAIVRHIGARTGSDQILVLHITDWKKHGGISFMRLLWAGPFGPRKRLELGMSAEVYNTEDGRRVWQSRARGETLGGRFGGTSVSLKRAVAQNAVADLLDSFLEP